MRREAGLALVVALGLVGAAVLLSGGGQGNGPTALLGRLGGGAGGGGGGGGYYALRGGDGAALPAEHEGVRGDGTGAKSSRLRGALRALEAATSAEATAAQTERSRGSSELAKASQAEADASSFMGRANKLMASERALVRQQEDVRRELAEIAQEHRNIRAWAACREGPDCEGGLGQDVWEQATAPRGGAVAGDASSALRVGGDTEALHPGRVSIKPYSSTHWHDTKPVSDWQEVKPAALKAGYDLSNCMVAAQKDKGVVRVRIVEKVPATMTKNGCTCKMPWTFYRGHEEGAVVEESKNLRSFDRCSTNGSPGHPWCAVEGDDCGVASDDPHAGHGEGHYGWTHWDYCDETKRGWTHKTLWEATHSAGEVTCVAEFLIASDKATEWRALDLLRQQVVERGGTGRPAAAELASTYEACIRGASSGSSAAFCETDMLSGLPQSLVRHALLISRASSLRVHWANRQRVLLLFALQLRGCLHHARGRREGDVCIAQLLSSMPERLAADAVSHALHTPPSNEVPAPVSDLSRRLVACMQASSDRDAAAFCVASFLSHAPHPTVREATSLARRVRDYGSAGFGDVLRGGAQSGWVGFKHIAQASGF